MVSYAPPALFVAWRDPDSRRIFPVGRLVRTISPLVGYEFVYVRGAHTAEQHGFQPFIAFPELNKVYRSRDLLPFFRNRILSPSRPEYERHVEALALELEAEPMTLLALSGGRRATDLVELFPDWIGVEGSTKTRFLLRGVQHVAGAEERIHRLLVGDILIGVPDLQNPVNPQAIKTRTEDGAVIGFLPDYLAADVTGLLQRNAELEIRVLRVNAPPMPRHHRVLCELSVNHANGFVGFRGDTFKPLSNEATSIDDKATASTAPTMAT